MTQYGNQYSPESHTKTPGLLYLNMSNGQVIIVIKNVPHDLTSLDTYYINILSHEYIRNIWKFYQESLME